MGVPKRVWPCKVALLSWADLDRWRRPLLATSLQFSGQCFHVRVRTSHSHAYCVYYTILWIETFRSTVPSWAPRKEDAYDELTAFNKSRPPPIPRPIVWNSLSTSSHLFQSHQISTSDYGPKITPEEVNCRMCKLSLRRFWKVQESLRSCDPDLVSPIYLITPKTNLDKNRSLALSKVLLGQPHTPSWVYWKKGKEGGGNNYFLKKTMNSEHTRVLWTKHLLSFSYIQSYWICPCKGSTWAHCSWAFGTHGCMNVTLGLHTNSHTHSPTLQRSTGIFIHSLTRRVALGPLHPNSGV